MHPAPDLSHRSSPPRRCLPDRPRRDDLPTRTADVGQATTEYALVLLGAALVALLVVGWATAGGGAGKIGHLFDAVIDAVTGKI